MYASVVAKNKIVIVHTFASLPNLPKRCFVFFHFDLAIPRGKMYLPRTSAEAGSRIDTKWEGKESMEGDVQK